MARGSWTGDVDVEAPLQAYVIGVIIPAAEKAADRIEKLDMSRGVYVWDNKFWYGKGSFTDALDRYSVMGEVERLTALSTMNAGISEVLSECAYSWKGAFASFRPNGLGSV